MIRMARNEDPTPGDVFAALAQQQHEQGTPELPARVIVDEDELSGLYDD